jgi:hypothetical protein
MKVTWETIKVKERAEVYPAMSAKLRLICLKLNVRGVEK